MKKLQYLFIALLILRANTFFAQADTVRSVKRKTIYEMGINLSTLTIRAGDFYSQYHNMADNQVFGGLYLKCFRKKNGLRFGIDYSQRDTRYAKSIFVPNAFHHGQIKSLEIKAGYQRMLGKKRLSLYFFTDLEYMRFSQQLAPVDIYSQASSTPIEYQYTYLYSRFFCFSPGLGLRWNFTRSVVLNLESAAQLFYCTGDPWGIGKSIGINAKPFKLSIGIIF